MSKGKPIVERMVSEQGIKSFTVNDAVERSLLQVSSKGKKLNGVIKLSQRID